MTSWTIAVNDLKLTFKDKMFLFWLIVFPFLFALIFGLAFRESASEDRKVTLNVVDKDKSFLSQALIEELTDEKYVMNLLKDEKESRVRALIIPENFSENILAGETMELILQKEEGGNLEASQAAYSHILKAIIKILTKIVTVNPQDESDLEQRYGQITFERLITLKSELAGKLQAIPTGFNHSIPAITVMFILFTVFMYGGISIVQERNEGQLERTYLSPATFSSIITGKWISRLTLGMLQFIILFAAGKLIFKTYLGNSLLALFLVALFLSGTAAGMSIFFGSVIRKIEILIIFNILVANTMSAFGGCWWPIEIVSPALRKVSFIFPTGWAMDSFHKLIFFGQGLEAVIPHILVLLGYTLVFLILAVKFFKLRKA
ncbi:MAG: ABC transporter permease [Candidatus Aminicenantes bacterium]|nr:ABC transporter permease [Candidatus Aminicenantes bacterium]MDH5383966.1 ABC transporter permease [Candidatus Aminicenantes bacterium]